MLADRKDIPISDFINAISTAIDLGAPVLNNHHQKVAYMAWRIAQEMGLEKHAIRDIILAAKVHDIGAFSSRELVILQEFEAFGEDVDAHALLGYKLLKSFKPLSGVARLIEHHHEYYDRTKASIPLGSYIIHLADRIAILFDPNREILGQSFEIIGKVYQCRDMFHPIAFHAFERLAEREYFWVEANSPTLSAPEVEKAESNSETVDLELIRAFAKLMAQLIDFRSRFTATHSSGVAAVASEIARIAGFSEYDIELMEIAGYVHDLGKLVVSNAVLEKTGALNSDEFNSIKKHTYYTFMILSSIRGMEEVAKLAAYHHERLNGDGYPFHISGEDFTTLSQIMAVADVLTALSEDRPYRGGLNREKTLEILFDMAENDGVDVSLVEMVGEEFSRIDATRIKAQHTALIEYQSFYNIEGSGVGARRKELESELAARISVLPPQSNKPAARKSWFYERHRVFQRA